MDIKFANVVVEILIENWRHVIFFYFNNNKSDLQPGLRHAELVHYFGGWVEGASKQTECSHNTISLLFMT